MLDFLQARTDSKTNAAAPRALVFCCLIPVVAGSWLWNHNFGEFTSIEKLRAMNDVPFIWRGFENTPHLWPDSLKWWHGPWIEQGVDVYRPISSYLLWIETALGFRYGFGFVAAFGIVLLAILSGLCCALAWVFTRATIPTLVAALLAPSARFWLMGGADVSWLAWYAVHHDLWMIGWLLSAILSWTLWLESANRRALIATWICFFVGVLSKEFLYIFPTMALVLALFYGRRTVEMRRALWQVAALFGAVGALFLLRHLFLPNAYNPPHLKWVHFLKRPFLYWFPAFYKYVLTEQTFLPALSLWCVAAYPLWIRAPFRPQNPKIARYIFAVVLGSGILLISALTAGIGEGFWYFVDGGAAQTHLSDFLQMMATYLFLGLIIKHRKTVPSIAILGVFMLAYAPVWTYLGWHYTLAGWFVRAALWWPLFALLLEKELTPLLTRKSQEAPL